MITPVRLWSRAPIEPGPVMRTPSDRAAKSCAEEGVRQARGRRPVLEQPRAAGQLQLRAGPAAGGCPCSGRCRPGTRRRRPGAAASSMSFCTAAVSSAVPFPWRRSLFAFSVAAAVAWTGDEPVEHRDGGQPGPARDEGGAAADRPGDRRPDPGPPRSGTRSMRSSIAELDSPGARATALAGRSADPSAARTGCRPPRMATRGPLRQSCRDVSRDTGPVWGSDGRR